MTSKLLLVPLAVVSAFILGSIVSGPTSNAFELPKTDVSAIAPQTLTPAPAVAPARAPRTAVRRPVAGTADDPVAVQNDPVVQKKKRSWQKEALIIGGSAGAGAAIGAVSGGKKGAVIGAISGGVAGTVYDLMTRNK